MFCENVKCNEEHDGSFGSGRFCSRKCANSRELTKTTNKPCVECGSLVEVVVSFPKMHVKCVDCKPKKLTKTYHNKGKPKPICPVCSTTLEKFWSRCCSKKCASIYKREVAYDKIKLANGIGCDARALKRYLIACTGHKCCICNGTEWNGQPMPLVMDHINGRANDNRLENLRLVCGNCDMQLPTYKSKNKNSDRKRK